MTGSEKGFIEKLMRSFAEIYLKDVLGISSVLVPSDDAFKTITEVEEVKILLLVLDDISPSAFKLVNKMAQMCPIQSARVIRLKRGMGIDEIYSRIRSESCPLALVFGSDLFAMMYNGDESYYSFTNEKFDFFGISVFASHDLEDMCTGPNVELLKKQVWQQMKILSRKS